MKIKDNTILITGGGSGIGRALAEAFHALGNKVVIAGRRQQTLDEVTAANPGMSSLVLDIESPDGIRSFAERATRDFPALNVVINNAGIMRNEDVKSAPDYLADAEATVATNLLGPIRLTAALLPHLQKQPKSAILMVSSGLAFVSLALTPTYCATKAAIHSYAISLRHQLTGTPTEVIEIIPPYVQTHLQGDHQANDPAAMPLEAFITEVMTILTGQPTVKEVVVKRCEPLRFAAANGSEDKIFQHLNP
ncbi:SDR family oxidoreductase [Telmatospirillum sp.]|uniref:SDR family oxidoreductase n=1 Tax=Telmatospirillum sp. TaxID=2079197 RepID=UPI0028430BAD|nr:SDR family oxidoreductase [Telmatospirillum sp.]MDR3438307.1 SDR family oxidoreductase [Telmatospirillum sp.]